MSDLDFSGRVAVITGAGGGLGRAYALLLAKNGCKVVVNDLGGTTSGEGNSSSAADVVVSDIQRAGGVAVANYDSVEFGDRIIKTAMDNFGRVDILINNAGILRDKSFAKMSDRDWDLVNLVHLKGSYSVSKAAWDIMRAQGYGRIIMTASAAGVYGNFGQANYSSAKLALLGLGQTLAVEGKKKGVFTNIIAPVAASRMTATVWPPKVLEILTPDYVAPVVAYLCHESCQENGGLFEVGGGWVTQTRRERAQGAFLNRLTLPAVRAAMPTILDFTNPTYPRTANDALQNVMKNLQQGGVQDITPEEMVGGMRFDGRVVIITGAGNGLGRSYALLFAAAGAKVVVNDLGGSSTGSGASSKAADVVVEEIKRAGGDAVANYDSVEFGGRIVETAMKAYGRIDVVIANAGILRDKSFSKMTEGDWDLINTVHVKGSYSVVHAAWPIMRQQGYGRVIFTTSAAGIYGNFGQANYSAAKMAILGLSQTLAIEGAKKGIFVNTIAPLAGSRLTATVMPPKLVEALKPSCVAPFVACLCHESSTETGLLFELGAGWFAAVRWQQAFGNIYPTPMTAAAVAEGFGKVKDFSKGATNPSVVAASMNGVFRAIEIADAKGAAAPTKATNKGKSKNVDVEKAMAQKFAPSVMQYTKDDVILYALAVGASRDPLDKSELNFTYENTAQFQALPTFGVLPIMGSLMGVVRNPGLKFNPMMLLHGEQRLEIRKAIPTSGTLTSTAAVSGVYDKGKNTLVVLDVLTKDSSGDEVFFNRSSLFIRGIGGFGGEAAPPPADNSPPSRAPDAIEEFKTDDNQALLYRLTGDKNPLHADPSMAKMGNFDRPILHGLCSMGVAGRAVLKNFAGNSSSRMKAIECRFASPVFPGETVVTEMWQVSSTKVVFRASVAERKKVVIANAAAEIIPASRM